MFAPVSVCVLTPSLIRPPDPLITPAKVVVPVLVPRVREVLAASETPEMAAPVREAICWLAARVSDEPTVPVSSMITALRVLVDTPFTMTVVGKALATAFYGKSPRYSYFIGSSTGGRQGLMEAQRYPDDYDGIFSGCPAVNWARMVPGSLWAQAVMQEANHYVSKAKLDAATTAAVAAGDAADGVTDGVIDDPIRATWDPQVLVGMRVGPETFTDADAAVLAI